jgi:MFS family permease
MSLTSMVVAPFAGRFADRIGGKYILTAGISLFAIGMATLTYVSAADSTWVNFLVPLIISGAGMGMTFAPMTTVALRNISPQMAGAASGVLNTTRQLGAAIGSAVVGAILQNQLATSLHNQAVNYSAQVPAGFRARFVDAFSSVGSSGFQIGTGQTGARLPAGLPPAVAQQLTNLGHDVFVYGFIDAMKQTLIVPIAFIVVTALSTLLIRRRKRPAQQQGEPAREELRAAAG